MKRILCLLFVLYSCWAFAKEYPSPHYVIISKMDSRYVGFLTKNVEAYYDAMKDQYFEKGWEKPLSIYYFEKQSDTQAYLGDNSIGYGIYKHSRNAVFTHRLLDEGGLSGIGTVFHEITHHFVEMNYVNPPAWFNEGLASFLSEQTRVVNGKLSLGHPNPWREQVLRDMIEKGREIDVARFTSLRNKEFYADKRNYHLLRAMFYWLYVNGRLKEFMADVKQDGYRLSVLERTTGKKADQINAELLVFIKKNCYAGAYVNDSLDAPKTEDKKRLLKESLELMPDYTKARYGLARVFYGQQDCVECQKELEPVLKNPDCIEYKDACQLMGDCCFKQNNIKGALAYYQDALKASDYDEYQYQLWFKMAGCCVFLGDKEQAKIWYQEFLNKNWEPESEPQWCKQARQYIEQK